MALTLSEIQAGSNDYWQKNQLSDIYFKSHILLWYMFGKGSPKAKLDLVTPGEMADGGEKIRVFLEYAKSNTGSYGDGTKIDQSKVKTINAARFRWGGAYGSNAISLNERVQNTGEAAMVKLIMTKMKNIQKSIRDQMGEDVYSSAADSNSILGLGNLFNTTTSTTYGGIAEDDMASWAANVVTDALTMGFKALQQIRRTASTNQNMEGKPNLYITTETLRDGYERTLQVQARYKDQKLLDAGFDNVLFGSAPVVADDKATSGYVEGLNTRNIKLKTHPDFAFTPPKWEYDKEEPDYWVANTRWIGQLVTSDRRSHCRANNVSEPS